MKTRSKQAMGKARQVRMPADVQHELQVIADANGLQWADAVRMALKIGLPVLKRRMGDALKQAA